MGSSPDTIEDPDKLETAVKEKPLSHPTPFSIRFFNFDFGPPTHIQDWYHQAFNAVYKKEAPKNCALFAPRGYAKTVSSLKIIPSWLALNFPSIRIGILSHKSGHANKRAKMAVNTLERLTEYSDVEIDSISKTTIQLKAGRENAEKTIEPNTIRGDEEGSHYDVVIYDDIATFGNQTTAHREDIIRRFDDSIENVAAKAGASCLPHGSVNLMIGTRKHHQDLYRQRTLNTNDYNWNGFCALDNSSPDWNTRVWRVTPDWHVIENEEYKVKADNGQTYQSLRDLPESVGIVDKGVIPTSNFRVLWPDFHPPRKVLHTLVTKSNLTVWRCENQQNPEVSKGQVLKADWLRFVDPIPRDDYDAYEWYAGLDFANPNNTDPEDRAENVDYWALSVLAHHRENDVSYITDMWRDKGYSWKEIATDFIQPNLTGFPVGDFYIESNFVGDEIADTISDNLDLDVRIVKSESSGDKEDRLNALGNKFQQGKIKIASDPNKEKWDSFLRNEWLSFPDADHDDRMDSMEIAYRGVEGGSEFLDPEEGLPNITWQ